MEKVINKKAKQFFENKVVPLLDIDSPMKNDIENLAYEMEQKVEDIIEPLLPKPIVEVINVVDDIVEEVNSSTEH